MTCKKHSSVALRSMTLRSVALRVIFRIYMFGILSKTLPNIFHQGLRSSEFESQISWISSLLSSSPPLLQSYPLLSLKLLSLSSILDHRRSPPSILSPPSLATVNGLPPLLATATTLTRNLSYANRCTGLLSLFKS